ncbi:Hint domain-containing protein [Aureimonas frigidaquae]|uniref:Hint domain-containing protein n=1 Tax=Aureimonas frigidaquae TaxID=424757 RepID=UPI0012EE6A1A|nr:Hint domain-containing protein [Aureimonas frigidaquae]
MYRVTLAVKDSILEKERHGNSSGFTFGLPQLDIGSNDQGIMAYGEILDAAVANGDIDLKQFIRLYDYMGVKRPDLDRNLQTRYKEDKAFLSELISNHQYAKDIVDKYSDEYLNGVLLKKINSFFDAIKERWGDDTVFNRSHDDSAIAIAAALSVANRSNGLNDLASALSDTRPKTIAAVKAAFNGDANEWELVVKGAAAIIAHCFIADTQIAMWNGPDKPIQEIQPGDVVLAYDENGFLHPGRVSRLFRNHSRKVLDLFGVGITPGHLTYCADGPLKGQHVPIIDILRADGAIVLQDGSCVRAATNCPVGSIGDQFVWAVCGELLPSGLTRVKERAQLRLGTRFITADGMDCSILETILQADGIIGHDGLLRLSADRPGMPFHWTASSSLPKPEDYVLARSKDALDIPVRTEEREGNHRSGSFCESPCHVS